MGLEDDVFEDVWDVFKALFIAVWVFISVWVGGREGGTVD